MSPAFCQHTVQKSDSREKERKQTTRSVLHVTRVVADHAQERRRVHRFAVVRKVHYTLAQAEAV